MLSGPVLALTLAASLLAPGVAAAGEGELCARGDKTVYVGGVTSMSSLADPAASRRLLATDRVGLYMHGSGIPPAYYSGSLPKIYRSFAQTGDGIGEVGFTELQNAIYMNGAYHAFYDHGGDPLQAPGQHPWAMIDNAPDDFLPETLADGSRHGGGSRQTIEAWQKELAAGHAHGIGLVVPVISPNDDVGLGSDPADSPDWALARSVATTTGSVAIDAPPHYFLSGNVAVPGAPASYQNWLVRFVRWAAAQDLLIFWIISPDVSGAAFLSDTQAQVARLAADGALPNYWIVENYGYPNAISGAVKQSGGRGYTHVDVTVSAPTAPWGTRALLQAKIDHGEVADVAVIDPGSGYLAATIAFSGDGTGAAYTATVTPDGLVHPPEQAPALNPNVIGTETLPQSVANVALWVAKNAPVRALPTAATRLADDKSQSCPTPMHR